MKVETIRKIGEMSGLEGYKLEQFIVFFDSRFPNENDEIHSYCQEWANRFKVNNPEVFMDSLSQDIYYGL